ncbi:class I SAM-dependent methyltransferase [Lacticaseibacillus sp. GG6-2]
MANEDLKRLYDVLEATTARLHQELKTSYLDAAVESGEDLMNQTVHQEDGIPGAKATAALAKEYAKVNWHDYSPEELRQALQLVLVKAVQVDGIEPNKQVTPDAMASLATFIATTFHPQMPDKLLVVDPTAGSGNLLFAVMNQLQAATKTTVQGVGIDNDETLLAFAGMSSALQQLDVQLYHQDALDQTLVQDADIVVADLPVGYYPLDERAKGFATAAKSGHSYAHHLLIEQGLKLLKPGGLGLFYVPAGVFQTNEAKGLTAWMTKAAYFQGLLNLPAAFFAKQDAQKSLLVLQKPGAGAVQAPQVLLGTFPDLNDRQAFGEFIAKVKAWAQANLS